MSDEQHVNDRVGREGKRAHLDRFPGITWPTSLAWREAWPPVNQFDTNSKIKAGGNTYYSVLDLRQRAVTRDALDQLLQLRLILLSYNHHEAPPPLSIPCTIVGNA